MSKKHKQPEVVVVEHEPVGNPAFKIWIGLAVVVLFFVGFITVVATIQGGTRAPIKLAPEEMKPAVTATPEPAPWTYDSVTNQHWDPTHKHWHTGRAPDHSEQTSTPPDIPNPAPWQYDAATNQFFDPDHNHWHTGQPPAEHAATPVATPENADASSTSAPAPVAVEEAVEPPADSAATPENADASTPAPAPVAGEPSVEPTPAS